VHRKVCGLQGQHVGTRDNELRECSLQAADTTHHTVHLVANAETADALTHRLDDAGHI